EIAELARLARPEVGLVTCIGETHIERLGSIENIACAKAELIQALPENGTAVLPVDDQYFSLLRELSPVRCITFGLDAAADIRGESISEQENGTGFDICFGGERVRAFIPLPGRHNVLNSLAAVATAVSLGLSLDECTAGLSCLRGCSMRLEMLQSCGGIRIISDVYNASPASVRAAIDVLSGTQAKRRIAVLADMLELGESSDRLHREIGVYAVERGVDLLFTCGSHAAGIGLGAAAAGMEKERIRHFSDKRDLAAILSDTASADDVILVKGSRGMAMEEIVDILLKSNAEPSQMRNAECGLRNNPSP
ncbi:MAG: UDP-N-acetylmuramoyl-tripeptide--D-alanyl-D-alanine ligase, partial [bacterium]|nr:UDP-N-acetylmuramoyl-tripeptide--D-alanyl-D-alanine ligase [bacterium]